MARFHRPGLITAALGLILAAASPVAGVAPAPGDVGPAAFVTPAPSGDYVPPGRDHWRHHRRQDWDGDRRHDGGWRGHPWRWWHDQGIGAQRCRSGGGHLDGHGHRCAGGRFDDFRVR